MNLPKRTLALVDLLLLLPAVLFMAALILRGVQPLQFEPAHAAQSIVLWYAGRMWTLWLLLIALPLVVLVSGGLTLFNESLRHAQTETATRLIAVATLVAGAILAVVAIHVMMN